jgi:signal peptidase I
LMSAWRWVTMAVAAAAAGFGAVRWRYCVVTVRGPSMEPELADGDRLLARRCGIGGLRRGGLVIFREPGRARRQRPVWLTGAAQDVWVIKHIAAMPGDQVPDAVRPAVGGAAVVPPGAVVVLGSTPASRDSRHWGFIPGSLILGVGRRQL